MRTLPAVGALAGLLLVRNGTPGFAQSASPAIPPAPEILRTLSHRHPRLLASTEEFTRLRERLRGDSPLGLWHRKLRAEAEQILSAPVSRYEIPDGLRLLATSRRVLHRVYVLAFLDRLDRDPRYAARAWNELDAAARFPDWNPRHFLDTAEMTHAFAIGYDWLYDRWSDAQRAALRDALVQKGLNLALATYRGDTAYGWWTKSEHNWNQVCNGGIGMGALAVADEQPGPAAEFLHAALKSLQLPMRRFAPDGAWDEGPGYWDYATTYNVTFLAALQTALGTDFGMSQIPGFAESGQFPIHLTGPLGLTFNYADGGAGTIRAPQMFWLARQFRRPAYAAYERRWAAPEPLDLLWDDPDPASREPEAALDRYFRNVEIATFRSAWDDREALFVGFKAGDNKANHSHLDLGSFVLDALGVRWVTDLGADDYNLPGYFGGQRWNYYRLRAEGHNTILVNPDAGPDQDPRAAARIVRFTSEPKRAQVVADLTPAYAGKASRLMRGLALLERHRLLVQDEVQTDQPSEVWWFLHTRAQVQIEPDGKTAALTQDGKRLWARVLTPPDVAFTVMDAQPLTASPHPERQAKNEGTRKLAVRVQGAKDLRLAVLLVPLPGTQGPPERLPDVTPLSGW